MELATADSSGSLDEQRTIQGDDLRGTGDRVLRQPGGASRELDVPGCVLPAKIARERYAHDCLDAATIEAIPLHHNDRTPEARAGTDGIREVCPVNVALGDYHSVLSRIRRAASVMNGSGRLSSSSHTRFMASVMASG